MTVLRRLLILFHLCVSRNGKYIHVHVHVYVHLLMTITHIMHVTKLCLTKVIYTDSSYRETFSNV